MWRELDHSLRLQSLCLVARTQAVPIASPIMRDTCPFLYLPLTHSLDGWADGRMDGWTDGRMYGWMDGGGCSDPWVLRLDGLADRWVERNPANTAVCEKNIPPEKKTHRKISLKNTKSGVGEQFLLLDCMAKACAKGVFFHRQR